MDRLAVRQAFKSLDDEIAQKREQARQNATCFYQGCAETPIKSHIISKKLLRRMAKKNKVLNLSTSESPFSDLIDAIDAGKSLEYLNIEPVLIDIGNVKLTDPLFCQPHDTSVFAQIDNREIAEHPERIPKQVLLLAYRALCSLTFQLSNHRSTIDTILEFSKKVGYKHSLAQPERYARLHRFLANDPMLAVYKRHEQIRKL